MPVLLIIAFLIVKSVNVDAPRNMSPTVVFVTLLAALIIDWSSLGPNSLRDRIAFIMAVPAIRDGFDGSPADQWTTGKLEEGIEALLNSPPVEGSYMAGAAVNLVASAVIGVLFVYALLCMLPAKASRRLGPAANLSFPASPQFRLNLPLWGVAIVLGMLADLPRGALGALCRTMIDVLTGPIDLLVGWAFGI